MATTVRAPAPPRVAPPTPAPPAPKGRDLGRNLVDAPYGFLEQIAGMLILTGKTMVACVTPPFSWRSEFGRSAVSGAFGGRVRRGSTTSGEDSAPALRTRSSGGSS
jgi:hypothetical protein